MLEQRIRFVSEALARTIDRRVFLRRTGSAVVSGVTALALGSVLSTSTARAAAASGPLVPAQPNCAPPGPYCNTGGGILSGCHGAHCYQHLSGQLQTCHVYYAYYPVGCWTSTGSGGFWTCCDCQCSAGATCGCAQFSATPAPVAE
jgi:hypothetical protein